MSTLKVISVGPCSVYLLKSATYEIVITVYLFKPAAYKCANQVQSCLRGPWKRKVKCSHVALKQKVSFFGSEERAFESFCG